MIMTAYLKLWTIHSSALQECRVLLPLSKRSPSCLEKILGAYKKTTHKLLKQVDMQKPESL